MLWGSVCIDVSKIYPPLLFQVPWLYKIIHFSCSFLIILYLVVSLWLVTVLVFSFEDVPLLCSFIFSICFVMSFSVRPGQFFRKPLFIALGSIAVFGLKNTAYNYCDSSGLFVWVRMLFTTVSDCCVSKGTSHITVCLFLVDFIISCPLLRTNISCLSSLMVHTSSHKILMILVGLFSFLEKCGFS